MDKKREFEYYKLGPSFVYKDGPGYKEAEKALKTAYKDDEIKNIAITGIYGAGKSSFLKTYFNDRKNEKLIKVAIADFEKSENHINNGEQDKIKVVERQLINQVLYQIPSHKIPRSKYKIKYRRKCWEIACISLWICILIITILSIFDASILEDIFKSNEIAINIKRICFTLFLMTTSIWIARRANFKFLKINYKGTESEIMEDDSKDLLDIEARELVYLILSSESKTVIFEDLDRFNDISIFIRLREINNLINSLSEDAVRFIYVIKDDLFKSKDRTKFFDFIIPIIPAVTSYNSKGKIEELFSDIKDEHLKISPQVLQQISIYIDDMRLMYSIRNEYEIYSKSIDSDVYSDQLFALIVLKNVFPKEYEELECDRGYFYKILNKRNDLIIEYQKSLNLKIKEKEELQNQIVTTLSDLLAINIPEGYRFDEESSKGKIMYDWYRNPKSQKMIYTNTVGRTYDFQGFINHLSEKDPELKKRLQQIDQSDPILKIESLNEEIRKLTKKINKRYITRTSKLLSDLNDQKLRSFFEEEDTDNKKIIESHYFNLVKYLLLSGLIDENYRMYNSYFYEGQLSKEDNKFINRVLSRNHIHNDYSLNNPDVVMEYFRDEDYLNKDIVNYDLISRLIELEKSKELNSILRVIIDNKDFEAINHVDNYDYIKLKNLVMSILDMEFENFEYIFNSSIIPEKLRLKMAGLACEYENLNPNDKFLEFIRTHSQILEMDFFEDKSLILNGLNRLKIKFNDVSKLHLEDYVADKVIENRLFIMNFENSFNLMTNINGKTVKVEKFFNYLSKEQFSELKRYVYENINNVISEYIDQLYKDKTYSKSGESQFIEILNSELNTERKLDLVKKEKTIITDLSKIEFYEILTELFLNNLVLYSKENINYYYNYVGKITPIIDYINRNYKGEITFANDIYLELLNCEDTDNSLYKIVANKFKSQIEFINSQLGIEKYKILSSNELIEFNKENFDILKSEIDADIIIEYLQSAQRKKTSKEIYKVLIDEDFTESIRTFTIEDILDNNILNEEDSKQLIDNHGQPISLFDIKNSKDSVKKYILENYFLESDYEKIAKDYTGFNFKDEISSKLKSSSSEREEFLKNDIPLETMNLLIKESTIYEYMKVDLIVKAIINRKHPDMWKSWISKIPSCSNIAKVFDNRRPTYNLEEENKIVTSLNEIGIISIREKDEDINQIFFRPNEFNKLVSQKELK